MSAVLINIDVDDLGAAQAFYTGAFDLSVGRRFGDSVVELLGLPSPIYLLRSEAGSESFAGGNSPRDFRRHWTPVHLDFVVDSIKASLARAVIAGARVEGEIRLAPYGKIVSCADPFGNGFCLIEFRGRGYDELGAGA